MAVDPEDLLPAKQRKTDIVLGEDISVLSEFELEERIAALESEVVRCREAIQSRRATKSAADAFFRR